MPRSTWFVAAACAAALPSAALARNTAPDEVRLSQQGALAEQARAAEADLGDAQFEPCGPLCGDEAPAPGGQAELAIAVDSTGQHVVIGFNDTRGFSLNPVSVSGYMWSDDGGKTFHDGGLLPVTVPTGTIGTSATRYPQVFGDPDIKYLGGCTFIYASIVVVKAPSPATAGFSATQALGIHRSTDCGKTWTGPYTITSAVNPNGQFTSAGVPRDSADKEFIDVDPETGRVLVGWSNFTSISGSGGSPQNVVSYSDDAATGAPPTWSPAVKVGNRGQSLMPRFEKGTNNAYVAWVDRGLPFPGRNIGFTRSTDNGVTWSPFVYTAPANFKQMDQVPGNDRVHEFPTIAVDNSGGPHHGTIYLAYASNAADDGADIWLQISRDGGLTFSEPMALNARPGVDRAQWFPTAAVDTTTGRVSVAWYDQGVAPSGDFTEIVWTWSDDGGRTWEQPMPVSERPFAAGWGNNTGQPNLGDYNMSVAQGGEFFAAFAYTYPVPFAATSAGAFMVPDMFFARIAQDAHKVKAASLHLASVTAADSGGNGYIDPGERVRLSVTLRNYVTNPAYDEKVRGMTADLATTTPGVTVPRYRAQFPNLGAGESGANGQPYELQLSPAFAPGADIELVLTVRSAEHGTIALRHTLRTGTPISTTLIDQNFEASPVAGWTVAHGAGTPTVPWVIEGSGFCGQTSRYAFHQNANDGTGTSPNPSRWERLIGPAVDVPADSQWVELEMDICTDTEDDPLFHVLAYDGFFLRVTDVVPAPAPLFSHLLEAFAEDFKTGAGLHYPKHFPRSTNPSYFEDMSVWAGDSGGVQHVKARLPGTAGRRIQLRFEYAQDQFATCKDVRPASPRCGVSVDNVVVRSVRAAP